MSDTTAIAARRSIFHTGNEARGAFTDPNGSKSFAISEIAPARRWSLRGDAPALAARGAVAGFVIDQPINALRHGSARLSIRLGPDEWLLIADDANDDAIAMTLASELADVSHTLVDVSHRSIAILLTGKGAGDVINTGCPLDLSDKAFPIGAATRTLFAKAEIVLARLPDINSQPAYRIEVWRSFGRYMAAHLRDSATLLGLSG